jgi:hypothetical protein
VVVRCHPCLLLCHGHGYLLHCESPFLITSSLEEDLFVRDGSALRSLRSRWTTSPANDTSLLKKEHKFGNADSLFPPKGHSQLPWWALIVALILSAAIFPFVIVVVSAVAFLLSPNRA